MTNNLLCVTLERQSSSFFNMLRDAGWKVDVIASLPSARKKIRSDYYSAGLLIINSINDAPLAEIEAFLNFHRDVEWVGAFTEKFLGSPHSSEFVLNHFFDFHTLPFDNTRLLHTLGHAHGIYLLRKRAHTSEAFICDELIVGNSPAIKKHKREIQKIAAVDAPVMIAGFSGSGKEMAAMAIHRLSSRRSGPFVPVNCSALPGALIQSELFGHEKGAFSGAQHSKQGFIEAAAGGTIFLDEIGDIPLDLQTNLLRFLQERTINRVGSTRQIHVDTRVIAATNIDLEKAVEERRFREDLYYRLNVLPLKVPSLREREEDIVPLAEYFYACFEKEGNRHLRGFSASAIRAMLAYDWPGNVRELRNRVQRALTMGEEKLISSQDMGLARASTECESSGLADARATAEKSALLVSLSNTGNNLTHTARELGVSRMTLYRLLEKYRI